MKLYIPNSWSEKGKSVTVWIPIIPTTTRKISIYISIIVIFRALFFPFQRPKPNMMEEMANGVPTANSIKPNIHQSPNNQMLDTDTTSNTMPYSIIIMDKNEIPLGLLLPNKP